MSAIGGVIWLALWVVCPAFVFWRLWLWVRRGQTELYPGVPALSRATHPIVYWLHVIATAAVATFFACVGVAFIAAALSR
jgi:hypothetical protein